VTAPERSLTPAAGSDAARANVGYVLVAGAAIGWGMWPLILRHAVMPAALQSAILLIVMTLGSVPVMIKDRVRAKARPVHWLGVAWLGVADALNVALFFAAYQRTTVAIAVLTHYLTPVLVALAAPRLLGERPQARTFGAVAISFAGLALLLQPWSKQLSSSDLVGAALGAGSAVFYASNVFVNKRLAHVFSASELMFFHGLVAVPFLWAMVPSGALGAATASSVMTVVLGSLGPGVLCGLMFVWGLRRIAASHASILTLLEPFVAVLVAVLFLGQELGPGRMFGGLLILTGAVVVLTAQASGDAARPQLPSKIE
jgi:drug/metabolite transporter (DMT)-like permease